MMETNEKRKTSSAMAEHMQKFPESGMTQKAYCEAHGISQATFGYWLKKYRTGQGGNTGSFVRIQAKGTEPSGIEIYYPNGIMIRVQGIADVRLIKELLR